MSDIDLWNQPIGAHKRKTALPKGHAANPGSGPKGETCGTCQHRTHVRGGAKEYQKCELCRKSWTHGPGSDIRAKDPACAYWKPKGGDA